MRIEHLFSEMESKTATVLARIRNAATQGLQQIDILERDVHTLFKFMLVSPRRSECHKAEVENPRRKNDFLFRQSEDNARKSGKSNDPGKVWLRHILYILETSHYDLLAAAEGDQGHPIAQTYKHFAENYALQIWKAAPSYDFFLNERLIDFESDTQHCLGVEERTVGPELIWMTTEDMIHLVLPISPEVAVVFCNEARCYESPFAEAMHQAKIPYPQNSLLVGAPHKDIVNVNVPEQKRGKKTWPATVAW